MKAKARHGDHFYEWLGDGFVHAVLFISNYGVQSVCVGTGPDPRRGWVPWSDYVKTDEPVDCVVCIGAGS